MQIYFFIFSFILGAIIGSFLNVVALRFNTGMTLGGRSKCFSCEKELHWYELLPIFSFIFQKGKCKGCKSKISWQYPLVEICAGIIFLGIFWTFPPTTIVNSIITFFYLFISCLLLIITIYDIKHKIIPNSLVYTFAFLTFIKLFFSADLVFSIPHWLDLIAGPALALPFFLVWLMSKGEWMGLGDAKLVLGIGWLLGLEDGISAVAMAFWIGAIVSIVWMYIVFNKLKARYEIPFGPYLILGMYISLLLGIKVIDLSFLFDTIR